MHRVPWYCSSLDGISPTGGTCTMRIRQTWTSCIHSTSAPHSHNASLSSLPYRTLHSSWLPTQILRRSSECAPAVPHSCLGLLIQPNTTAPSRGTCSSAHARCKPISDSSALPPGAVAVRPQGRGPVLPQAHGRAPHRRRPSSHGRVHDPARTGIPTPAQHVSPTQPAGPASWRWAVLAPK